MTRCTPQAEPGNRAPLSRRTLEEDLARLAGLLARGGREDLGSARRIVASLRRALGARRPDPVDPGQERLVLPMASDALVLDCPLGCPVSALVCTSRQIQSELEIGAAPRAPRGSSRAKRGRTPTRPTCVTSRCSVGAAVRERHGDTAEARAMAARAPRESDAAEGRRDIAEQVAARARLRSEGALDESPSIDAFWRDGEGGHVARPRGPAWRRGGRSDG